jgi:uncharacterized protein (DUF1501 family)
MRFTRRALLSSAASVLATLPTWMPRLAFAAPETAPRGDTLVCVFLRGAADMLNAIVPHGEAAYYRQRPFLAIPRPDDRQVAARLRTADLDGFFGLHPALTPLLPAWAAGHLALVHACGTPDESRSHFRAMELMERGVDGDTGPASGWIGRHLASLGDGGRSPLRAIGFGTALQRALYGPVPATALRSIADFHLGGALPTVPALPTALAGLYAGDEQLAATAQSTLDIVARLERLDPLSYRPGGGATYPESELGMALRQTALLIKADLGLEVACIDVDGWDTHIAQGGSEGLMAGLLSDLGAGLAAFHADLAAQIGGVTLVVMSEFGRRVTENGGFGTDHGHGGAMIVLGGAIAGGRVYGAWPGLEPEQLIGPGDLAVTTDYRAVLADILQHRLGCPDLASVFPGFAALPLGIVQTR